jgi:hypothetical protein
VAASGSTSRTGRALKAGPALAVGIVALALVLLAAWRSTIGISFADDGYYAAATLRLAQSAHLFADEMFLQSVGFLAALPFAKLWTLLLSTAGFVAALRVFYVAIASVAAFLLYRVLRPSFGAWPALAAASAPLLAPAYNLLAVSYDTMAAAGMVLACVLAFAALRDDSRRSALFAGAVAAFACVSYPPMAPAAFALLGTFWWLGRGRRMALPMIAGAAAVVVLFAAWLATQATLADLGATIAYIQAAARATGPLQQGGRLGSVFGNLYETLVRVWGVPIWAWFLPSAAVSLATALPAMRTASRARVRGLLLAALPLALALPVLANSMTTVANGRVWTFGGNYLVAFVLFAFAPMVADLGTMRPDMRRLVDIVVPPAVAGMLVVTLLSSASLYWASGIVGLAPLVVAMVVWWAWTVERPLGARLAPWAVLSLLAALLVLLFGGTFNEPPAWSLRHTITTGAYAGITTTEARARSLAAVEELTARWVRPGAGVLFIDSPGGYLTLGSGVPVTPVTWLDHGSADAAAVAYYDRIGRWPDVVFVATGVWTAASAPGVSRDFDPLLVDMTSTYRVAETSSQTGFTVLVRK